MTGPKGPWEERGNQEFCVVSPEFTYLWICAGGCNAVDRPKDKPDGVFIFFRGPYNGYKYSSLTGEKTSTITELSMTLAE